MHGTSIVPEALPLYQQVMEDIKRKIDSGELQPGDKIPSEAELIREFQVSRITIRRAISDLCTDGYLTKKQGIGTFVSKHRIRRLISNILSFSESCRSLGMTPSYRQNKLMLVAPRPDEQAFLKLGPDEKLIYSNRVLYADQVPIMQENCFFPYTSKFLWILETSLEQPLYPLLEQHGVLPRASAKRTLEISVARPEMAAVMQMPVGGPLFYKNAYLLDESGEPLFIERSYIVGTRYVFDIS